MKHAYLIMAHKDDLTFQTLIKMLDYKENDVFVHFDAKVRSLSKQRIEQLTQSVTRGRLFFIDRIKVNWGSYSMIKCELLLLKKAMEVDRYDFYHLLSGEDLPIQTHDDICHFFSEHKDFQYIGTGPIMDDNGYHDSDRIKYYHFFQERVNKNGNKLWRYAEKISIAIQKIFRTNRNMDTEFMRGPQWFSIKHNLAQYIVDQELRIRKLFQYSFCGDELFVQTIIHGTCFENELFSKGNERCIDWKRGGPYIWHKEDYEELKKDDRMFARKFDAAVDKKIIEMIYELYH